MHTEARCISKLHVSDNTAQGLEKKQSQKQKLGNVLRSAGDIPNPNRRGFMKKRAPGAFR